MTHHPLGDGPDRRFESGTRSGERIYLLENPVQPYAWGSTTVLPELLGYPPTATPAAELWVGAHPAAPSRIAATDPAGGHGTLLELIDSAPRAFLGSDVDERFGQLPYLLKILAVAHPLSLQAHPSLDQARAGFAAEQAAGIALDATARNYKDANHKPEQVCALTEFSGLCGFRPVVRTADFLAVLDTPLLAALRTRLLAPGGLTAVVTDLLRADPAAVEGLLAQIVPAAGRVHRSGAEWAAEAGWIVRIDAEFPADRGTVIALLLNLVQLHPGQALFLPAGQLHAYLDGVAVEVLANSDNVLRGGLTGKHIDVAALLAILHLVEHTPEPADPVPAGDGVAWYPSAVPDFRLGRFDLTAGVSVALTAGEPRILLSVDGTALVRSRFQDAAGAVAVATGAGAFLPASISAELSAGGTGSATVFVVRPNV